MIGHFFRKTKLRTKFLLITLVGLGLFMGMSLYQGIVFHTETAIKQVTEFSNTLLENTYSGMKFPMSVGDSKAVEEQLKGISQHIAGVQIYISDFFHNVTYASEEKHIHNKMESYLQSREALSMLENTLLNGVAPGTPLVESEENDTFLVTIKPILNEPACYHCHTDYRNILGAIVVKQSIKEVLASIHTARNQIILYSIISLVGLVVLINFVFVGLVSKRIRRLETVTSQVAAGDVAVDIHDDHEDSIGQLSNNFNKMVKSIRDRIEYANSIKLAISDPFFIVDTSMHVTFVNEAVTRMVGRPAEEILGKVCEEVFQSDSCENDCPVKKALLTGKSTVGKKMILTDNQGRQVPVMSSASALRDAAGNALGAYEIIRDLTVEVAAEQKLHSAFQREEEVKSSMEDSVHNLSEILDRAAHGDFVKRGVQTGVNESMDLMTNRINETLDGMVSLISQVKDYIDPVIIGIRKISGENENLSQRTQQQAAAMEEISSTLEQLVVNINENLNNTRQADSRAKEAVRVAEDGRQLVEKTAQAMVAMSVASNKIVEMMELVKEITFQTNLLSVNAAVEAARAGELGRGFAVVAEEVRSLAKRSSASAKDIEILVREIMASTNTAHQWVDKVAEYFLKIYQTSTEVSKALEEVTLGSEESSTGIVQINKGILELCDVNEKNTCFADDITNEMRNLRNNSEELKKITEVFILPDNEEGQNKGSSGKKTLIHEEMESKVFPGRDRGDDLRQRLLAHDMESHRQQKEFDQGFKEF